MRKQHFEMIAKCLGEAMAEARWDEGTSSAEEVVSHLVDKFAAQLTAFNPHFHADAFRLAVQTNATFAARYMEDNA